MKHLTIILAFLMTLSSPVAAQDFDKGYAAYKAGDYQTAIEEFTPLAEAGNSNIQYVLGEWYDNGEGVPQDHTEAVKWYRLAADQGNATAQYNLAVKYADGTGVAMDYKEANKLYRLASEQGLVDAQRNLGFVYARGKGVLQDNTTAHMWFNIAAANGQVFASINRDALAEQMTSEDISKAQAMARECMNSNYKECGY